MLDLLAREHAVVWPEVEAKLADRHDGPQPHILSKARLALQTANAITSTTSATRGGRAVQVWHLTDLSGRERHFADAAGRKRLLYARHMSWNNARPGFPNGFMGPAGERVLHQSLTEAAPYGYRLVRPEGGPVTRLVGTAVPVGPLDSAALLQTLDTDGAPAGQFVIPIEVKNVRHWLYPSSNEVYQLLYKAALLQNERPNLAFVPVLVCRRRSYFLWAMGKELGFFPIEVQHQYILPHSRIRRAGLDEVRQELGYADLTLKTDAEPRLVTALATSLPAQAQRYSERWKAVGATLADYYKDLREFSGPDRRALLEDLRDAVQHLPDCAARW